MRNINRFGKPFHTQVTQLDLNNLFAENKPKYCPVTVRKMEPGKGFELLFQENCYLVNG
jgi:hypothetical protein